MAKSREEISVIMELLWVIKVNIAHRLETPRWDTSPDKEKRFIVPLDGQTKEYKYEGLFRGWEESTVHHGSSVGEWYLKDYNDRFMPIILKYLSEIGVEAKPVIRYYRGAHDRSKIIDDPDSYVAEEKSKRRCNALKEFSISKHTDLELTIKVIGAKKFFDKQWDMFLRMELKQDTQEFVKSEMYRSAKQFCDRISIADYAGKLLSAIGGSRCVCDSNKISWGGESKGELSFASLGLVPLSHDYQMAGVLLFIAENKAIEMGMSFNEAVNRGRFSISQSSDKKYWSLRIYLDDINENYIPVKMPKPTLNEW